MLLEPALQQFVDAVAAHALPEDLRELRAISESALPQLQGAPQPVAHVIEHTVIARDGHALELRFYTPEGLPDGPVPALLFAHGGGWFQCSLAVYDGPCRALANASGCVIVAVGYRLAPEHPFPVPLHDVADAWRWLQDNAERLGLDPRRLAIGGDSAGGNLAAAQESALAAVQLAPNDANVWTDLCRFRANAGDMVGAMSYKRAQGAANDTVPAEVRDLVQALSQDGALPALWSKAARDTITARINDQEQKLGAQRAVQDVQDGCVPCRADLRAGIAHHQLLHDQFLAGTCAGRQAHSLGNLRLQCIKIGLPLAFLVNHIRCDDCNLADHHHL